MQITLDEFETYISKFFDRISYDKYCELCGGYGDVSEEEWEKYKKIEYLFRDVIHNPNLERMLEIGKNLPND